MKKFLEMPGGMEEIEILTKVKDGGRYIGTDLTTYEGKDYDIYEDEDGEYYAVLDQ